MPDKPTLAEAMAKFDELNRHSPKLHALPDGYEDHFWEDLYQAFKARYEAEKAEPEQ